MDTEMTDPAPLVFAEDNPATANLVADEAGSSKKRKTDSQGLLRTGEGSSYNLLPCCASIEAAKSCHAMEVIANVALEDVYQQMKLGIESFSAWWQKLFPEGTYEDIIQRAFEMYRLLVTEEDLANLMAKHAGEIPFSLSDMEVKRKKMIDDVRRYKMQLSDSEIEGTMSWTLEPGVANVFAAFLHSFVLTGCLNEQECQDMLGKTKEELTPANLATFSAALKKYREYKLVSAQNSLVSFSNEWTFWHTMSRPRPGHMYMHDLGPVLPLSVYLEKAKLGYPAFKSWAKKHFAAAAHPLFDDKAIKALFEMISLDSAEVSAEIISQKKEAEKKWREAIGVPLDFDFDGRRKLLLSKIKDAQMKASDANIEKRIKCYVDPIDGKINVYTRIINRLALIEDDSDDEDEEGTNIADIEHMVALRESEEAKKTYAVLEAYKRSWKEEAWRDLEAAREDLKKHLSSITRRQYMFSTIKINLNPWCDDKGELPSGAWKTFRLLSDRLKPHEIAIGNFLQAINLNPGQHEYYTMKAIQRKKMARLAADKGKPLSEGAKYFFRNECDAYPPEIFNQMKEYISLVEEATGKRLHLLEVAFDVNGDYAHPDNGGCMRLYVDVYGIVKEEVDVLSKYKSWVSRGRKTRAKGTLRECCSGQYHVVCAGTPFFADGDGFNNDLNPRNFEEFSEFYDSFYNQKQWTEGEDWDFPFSITADGTLRQRRFVKTADGRTTFPMYDGTPYDPVDFPMSLKDDTEDWEDFLQKHDADVAEKRKEFEEKQKK